jgi:hypothetical protein
MGYAFSNLSLRLPNPVAFAEVTAITATTTCTT